MMKNNNFWIAGLLYLEEQKQNYISKTSKNVQKAVRAVFKRHTNSIKQVSRSFKSEMSFDFSNELGLISKAFNIDFKRTEWIFIIQESQQRILSMIDIDKTKFALKRNLKICIKEGEDSNNFIREQLQAMQDDYEIMYLQQVKEAEQKANFKEAGKLIKKANDIQEYTEVADEASDHILDLFLNCKTK